MSALALATGLFAQVAQIVMFREMLAVCRGTEVFFGVVLAASLGWTALGGLSARLAARRGMEPQRAWSLAAALFSLNGLLLVGQIAMVRHRGASWGGAEELTFLQAVATAALATAPVAFACGAEFVLALHAAPPAAFGGLYQADAWGAAAGGLAFTFLLVGLVDPVTLGPALGAALCLAVLLAGGRRWMPTGLALGAATAAAVAGFGLDGLLHARRWRALLPGYLLRATRDSRYGQIAALRHPAEAQDSLYLDGGLVETLPPPGAPAPDERGIALLALAQHPEPRRVLLVGRALGRLPGELLRLGVERLDALELDPALFETARGLGEAPRPDPRLHVHFADGRYFVRHSFGARYDLILLQLPPPLSAFVNRFFTFEFFYEARAALDGEGVLVTSVAAAANYQGEAVGALSASVLRTLSEVFPEVLVAPGESHTFVAAMERGTGSLDPAVLARRMAGRPAAAAGVGPDFRDAPAAWLQALFENLVVTSQVDSLRRTLDSIPAPVNYDARPITYQYALVAWNQVVSASTQARDPGLRGGSNALFRAALGLRFAHGLVLPGLMLLPAVVLLAAARLRRICGGAAACYGLLAVAFATGLFGMAVEIILIYGFQAFYGYAYAEVGLLVAAFMVGLAVGARAGVGWARDGRALGRIVAAMVLYCLVLAALLGGPAASALSILSRFLSPAFLALAFGAGFLDGATFPPLVGAMGRLGLERPGGWVYAADLAGAALGALVTGALLVPVLGAAAALVLVALTLAAALLAGLAGRRRV